MIKISEEFKKYDYSFNRGLSSVISLPFSKNDILLGANELVNGDNFNNSLYKLQSNLMYLYSVSKFANPDLPTLYNGFLANASLDAGSQNLDVVIGNFTTYNTAKEQFERRENIPYFYVTDNNNKTTIILYTYNGVYNSDADSVTFPVGKRYEIEEGGDLLNAQKTAEVLADEGFTTDSYRYSDRYPGTSNDWPVIEISLPEVGDAKIFGNKEFSQVSKFYGNQPLKLKYQQGKSNLVFKLHDSNRNINTIQPTEDPFLGTNVYDNLVSFTTAKGNLSGFRVLFGASETSILSLSASINSSLSSNYIFANTTNNIGTNNDLKYKKINGIVYAENSIYISDEVRNNVIRVNVSGFTEIDDVRNKTYFETEIIGGKGEVRDNYQFNKPLVLDFYNNELYVLDQNNTTIKVYDKDLGFVRNIRRNKFVLDNPPSQVKIFNGDFYWLTKSGTLFVLDENMILKRKKELVNSYNSEEFLSFDISQKNNTIYLCTKQNIYKYFLDSLGFIGIYNLEKNNIKNTRLSFLSIIDGTDDKDLVYVYGGRSDGNDNKKGAILVFDETNIFVDLLSDYDFDIYSFDEVKVDKNEFVSNFAYNKSIVKSLNNNLQLRNFIYRKVNYKQLRNGGITYEGITYFNNQDLKLTNFEPDFNNYIGTNEIFSSYVANRVLEETYDLQIKIANLFENNVTLPDRSIVVIDKAQLGIMLETYPGNPFDFYLLENAEQPTDAILQEDEVLQQYDVEKIVTVITPPAPETKLIPKNPYIQDICENSSNTALSRNENNTLQFKNDSYCVPLKYLKDRNALLPPSSTVGGTGTSIESNTARVESSASAGISLMFRFGFVNEAEVVNVNNNLTKTLKFSYLPPAYIYGLYVVRTDSNWALVGIDYETYEWNGNDCEDYYMVYRKFNSETIAGIKNGTITSDDFKIKDTDGKTIGVDYSGKLTDIIYDYKGCELYTIKPGSETRTDLGPYVPGNTPIVIDMLEEVVKEATSPNSDEPLFNQGGNCTPPYDLIDPPTRLKFEYTDNGTEVSSSGKRYNIIQKDFLPSSEYPDYTAYAETIIFNSSQKVKNYFDSDGNGATIVGNTTRGEQDFKDFAVQNVNNNLIYNIQIYRYGLPTLDSRKNIGDWDYVCYLNSDGNNVKQQDVVQNKAIPSVAFLGYMAIWNSNWKDKRTNPAGIRPSATWMFGELVDGTDGYYAEIYDFRGCLVYTINKDINNLESPVLPDKSEATQNQEGGTVTETENTPDSGQPILEDISTEAVNSLASLNTNKVVGIAQVSESTTKITMKIAEGTAAETTHTYLVQSGINTVNTGSSFKIVQDNFIENAPPGKS